MHLLQEKGQTIHLLQEKGQTIHLLQEKGQTIHLLQEKGQTIHLLLLYYLFQLPGLYLLVIKITGVMNISGIADPFKATYMYLPRKSSYVRVHVCRLFVCFIFVGFLTQVSSIACFQI
jgi:hypothetical protein